MQPNEKTTPEPLWDSAALAAYLGVTVRTIHDWRMRGDDMPMAYVIAGKLRFRPSQVEGWVTRQRVSAATADCPETAR
ncbi:helix-turn-helix domain-containing protein [Pseudactinotalea sp. Z1739]|uniref:helix-turn-helix domain-containing protein n=1 Tax=Pseudactinotalea sp. Z1739 TaxID=3413028 RepID=UPI003C7E44A3